MWVVKTSKKVIVIVDSNTNIFRLLRIARDMKVKDLACALRVTPAYISAIENGSRVPSIRLIKDYAEVLNVDESIIHDFLKEPEQKNKFEDVLLRLLKKIVE